MSDENTKATVEEINENDFEKISGGSGYEADQEFVINGNNVGGN